MSNVIELVLFKVKEGISEQQLLSTSDEINKGFLSLQKGFLSRKLAKNEDNWTDIVLWETMEDALNAMKAAEHSSVSMPFFQCIEESSCELQHFTVAKSY